MRKNKWNIYFLPELKRRFEKIKLSTPNLGKSIEELRDEVGYYLAAHRAAGITFDGEYQEIIYSDGVIVVLRQLLGTWIIFQIRLSRHVREYLPVFVFQRFKDGASERMKRVLKCWRYLFEPPHSVLS